MRTQFLARAGVALAMAVTFTACSGDDPDGADDAAPAETTEAPASEPVGTLTFAGATYELTRSDCEVGGEGLSRWFAYDADGDVELAVYEGDVNSVSLLVRDDHPDGPAWEQIQDPELIDVDGDAASVVGSATVAPVAAADSEDATESVEFDFSC